MLWIALIYDGSRFEQGDPENAAGRPVMADAVRKGRARSTLVRMANWWEIEPGQAGASRVWRRQ